MRDLNESGKLTDLQASFFADSKPTEELYDIINDPFEATNLIGNPEYNNIAKQMRSYYKDWNSKNHDFGLDPINWGNCPPPNATEVIEWLKKERPEIIKQMKQGIEPGFGKLVKEFNTVQKE